MVISSEAKKGVRHIL